MNIVQFIEQTAESFSRAQLFYGHGTDNAWDEACYLVLGFLELPFESDADDLASQQLTEDQEKQLQLLLEQRIEHHTPVAYLLGKAEFYGLSFKVSPDVLIPRSPIAELIVNDYRPWFNGELKSLKILDMCCGSACLGILAAKAQAGAQVTVSDISLEALALANENIKLHDVQEQVIAVCSDLFNSIEGQFDILICNPPYVDAEDMSLLPAEYRHEPELALACGEDGLDLAKQILRQASDYLSAQGLLILELGNSYQHLEQQYPDIEWLWADFEFGGIGVLVITRSELVAIQNKLFA